MKANSLGARGLSVRYENVSALELVDFEVEAGQFVSIVGTSGSGKTTLLNALAGFVPYTGDVMAPARIGVVFQDYSVFPWMTVAENIAFGIAELEATAQREIVRRYLELVQLEDKANRYPGELSGGQIQRVAIARAFAASPDVILMDEPFGSLDRHTRERMQQWLLSVWSDRDKTIVFVTHDIEEAIFLSDRVVVLHRGRVTADMPIQFPRPRSDDLKFDGEFMRLKKQVLMKMTSA